MLPLYPPAAVRRRFAWKFVNYAPIVTSARCLLTIWWNVSAKNWFTGPSTPSTRPSSRRSRTDEAQIGTEGDLEQPSSTRYPSWQVRDQSRTCRAG